MPNVGDTAPDFKLLADNGKTVRLSDFRGKHVVLYFYPKDDTPGCTKEACSFRDQIDKLNKKNAVVMGVSLDDLQRHQAFKKKYELPFPLLVDLDAKTSKEYGVYKLKNLYGRQFWGIERTTFIIEPQGKIAAIFPRVKVDGHVEEVFKTLS